ncbi:hypothetical protein ACLB2K_025350 [Fragaria x ananassa]
MNMEVLIQAAFSVLFIILGTLGGYFFGRDRGRKDQITVVSDQPQPVSSVVDQPKNDVKPPPAAAMLSKPKDEADKESIISKRNTLFESNKGVENPLKCDCELQIFTFEDNKGRDTFWHSGAHILGQALEAEYGCKLCIGPCTTKQEGFYYDAYYGGLGLNDEHLKKIESEAEKAVKAKQCFERIEVSREQALEIFLITNSRQGYNCIQMWQFGGHVKAFRCLKASSAYWRSNKDRESLQRVYGISYPDKKLLQAYINENYTAHPANLTVHSPCPAPPGDLTVKGSHISSSRKKQRSMAIGCWENHKISYSVTHIAREVGSSPPMELGFIRN